MSRTPKEYPFRLHIRKKEEPKKTPKNGPISSTLYGLVVTPCSTLFSLGESVYTPFPWGSQSKTFGRIAYTYFIIVENGGYVPSIVPILLITVIINSK